MTILLSDLMEMMFLLVDLVTINCTEMMEMILYMESLEMIF